MMKTSSKIFMRIYAISSVIPSKMAIWAIRVYQRTLSPDQGVLRSLFSNPVCVMYPSCSEYAVLSIQKHGFFRGSIKAVRRVVSCNPFQKRLVDLP
jgi:putative membrane protein insertion efficiency factor